MQKKHIVYRPSTGSKVQNIAETYQPQSNQKGSGSGSRPRQTASRPASSKLQGAEMVATGGPEVNAMRMSQQQ